MTSQVIRRPVVSRAQRYRPRQGGTRAWEDLESATGLGGRSRAFTDPGERARSAVSKAIERTINVIDDASPAVAAALRDTILCGVVCSYVPDATAPVTWSTRPVEDRPSRPRTSPGCVT